jgi:hypothetical protein
MKTIKTLGKIIGIFFGSAVWAIITFIASTIVVFFFTMFCGAMEEGTSIENTPPDLFFRMVMGAIWIGPPVVAFGYSLWSGLSRLRHNTGKVIQEPQVPVETIEEAQARQKREKWEYENKPVRRLSDVAIFPWEENLPGMTQKEYDEWVESQGPPF